MMPFWSGCYRPTGGQAQSKLSLFCPDEQTGLLLLLLQGTYLAVRVATVQCPELTGDLGDTRERL